MSTSASWQGQHPKYRGERRSREGDKPTKKSEATSCSKHSRISIKNRSAGRRLTTFALRRRWPIPAIPLLVVILAYLYNPSESNVVHRLLFLSYQQSSPSEQYGKGPWDIAFVLFYTLVLSFFREFVMQELLLPMSLRLGIRSKRVQARFMEQMYTVLYFGIMGPFGLYVMRNSVPEVWYFRTNGMYASFPHRFHDAKFKFYYLFQAAYWAQQMLVMVLGLEKPRKDFKELVMHHIVTLLLIGLSYRFHFTYIGIAIYVTHDVSDFFLAISKSFQYTNSPLVAPAFAICIIAWVYLRHYLNLCILISMLPGGAFQTVGPYTLDWETEQYKCLISNVITFMLLACLQGLNLFWLYCLGRNAYRYVVFRVAKDDRSDVEDDETVITSADGKDQG